ncbi:MAG: hypothetical protein ABIT83_25865 [Massilia sp.]
MNLPSLPRIVTITSTVLIGLSLVAQCAGLILARSGGVPTDHLGLLALLGMTRFALVPGIALALVFFLLNAVRSVRDPGARLTALVFFLITLFPLLSVSSLMPRAVPGEASGAASLPAQESAQFVAGDEWAALNKPPRGSACPGSSEFIRGCRHAIERRRSEQTAQGRAWAVRHKPAKGSDCRGAGEPYFVLGCRQVFTEQLAADDPRRHGSYKQMTGAECRTEVNANYEAGEQIDLENGNPQSAAVVRRKHWEPDLKECDNLDRQRDNAVMPAAYARLQALIEKLNARQTVSEDDKTGALKDFSAMAALGDQPYKTAYMRLFEEYSARLNGDFKEAVVEYPRISCEQYQAKIDEMRRRDKERVAAMQALRLGDVITSGAAHDRLNQERIAMLWDWKLYNDGARTTGCAIKPD